MIDQQNRKAIGTPTPWQTVRITTTKRSQFTSTQSLDGTTRIKGGCALSAKRIRRQKGNVREETEDTTSDGKGKGKEKGKGKGRTYHDCGEQGHFARECPAPTGKGQDKNLLSPRQWTQHNPGFIPTGGKEIRKSGAKAQTNLMENEVCPS